MTKHPILIFLAIFSLLSISACSKITIDNYARLKVGMDFTQVVDILGTPAKCAEVKKNRFCRWGSETQNIKIAFVANRATLTSKNGLK